jgi:isoleucyl-tRNA synthetase
LRLFPEISKDWRDDALAKKWSKIRHLRRVVTGALEIERAEKRIGSSLQSAPVIYADSEYKDAFKSMDAGELADLFITSGLRFEGSKRPTGAFTLEDVPGVAVVPEIAQGKRCERCWKILDNVGSNTKHPEACPRCADAADHHPGPIE